MSSKKITPLKSSCRFLSELLKLNFFQALIIVVLTALTSTNVLAQFTKLLDFGRSTRGTSPYSSLISDRTFLYGTTSEGGVNGVGTIYKIKPDGTGFLKLFDFDGGNGSSPYASLFFDGTYLYGTTSGGGDDGHGVIFKIKPDGTGFTKLLDFVFATHGAFPIGALISDGTFLYGMTVQGGTAFYGTVFKIKTDGTAFSKLLEFDGATNGGYPYGSLYYDGTSLYGLTSGGFTTTGTAFKIQPDGSGYQLLIGFNGTSTGRYPMGSFISDGTFLYATTFSGGINNLGTIVKIKTDGTGFSKMIDFDNSTKTANPKGSLVSDGTFLYGMTTDFGVNGRGIIFKIKTDGTGYTKIFDNDVGTDGPNPEGTLLILGSTLYGVYSGLGAGVAPFPPGTIFKINTEGTGHTKLVTFETEGTNPSGSLLTVGAYQYGMTYGGGVLDYGTIFRVKPDGTGYTRLLDFDGQNNGRRPAGSLISDGTYLYGMTAGGGVNDYGVIFKIKPDGSGYVKLLDFDYTNNGNLPGGDLLYDGTFLYGATANGGLNSSGTVFKIKPDGTAYTKLLDFDYNNGAYPKGSLISDGTFLYGTSSQGGANGNGTIFKILPDGTGFTSILDFDDSNNGSGPNGSLLSNGTFMYGMTSGGGDHSVGTVFKIKPDGTGYSKLLDFDEANNGSYPFGSFIIQGSFLYGMTSSGGALGLGTIFNKNRWYKLR